MPITTELIGITTFELSLARNGSSDLLAVLKCIHNVSDFLNLWKYYFLFIDRYHQAFDKFDDNIIYKFNKMLDNILTINMKEFFQQQNLKN